MESNLLSRKFIFAILFGMLAFVLVVIGKITSEQWVGFIEFIGSAYILGNVAATVANKLGSN